MLNLNLIPQSVTFHFILIYTGISFFHIPFAFSSSSIYMGREPINSFLTHFTYGENSNCLPHLMFRIKETGSNMNLQLCFVTTFDISATHGINDVLGSRLRNIKCLPRGSKCIRGTCGSHNYHIANHRIPSFFSFSDWGAVTCKGYCFSSWFSLLKG